MAEQEKPSMSSNPKACALITQEAVIQALKNDKGTDAVLKSFKVVDFTQKGDNYACFVTSVEVEYLRNDQDCSVTYIVKLNPCTGFESFEEFTTLMFVKEATFYEKTVPRLNAILKSIGGSNLRMPAFYYASYEPKKEIIFMEDMRKKGYRMHDRKQSMDVEHASLVLRELARLHAAGKLLLQKEGKEILPELVLDKEFWNSMKDNEQMLEMFNKGPINVGNLIKPCGGYDKTVEALTELAPNAFSLMLEHVKPVVPFDTICHGDCWNNNLLFRYEGETPVEVCMVDLQINRYSSVASDLRYFMCASLTADVRIRHSKEFLSTYYATFVECMGAAKASVPFSKEAFLAEYKSKGQFGLLIGMMVLPGLLVDASDALDFSAYSEDDMQKLMEDSEAQLQKTAEKSPLFRPRLLGLMEEMIEEGILPK